MVLDPPEAISTTKTTLKNSGNSDIDCNLLSLVSNEGMRAYQTQTTFQIILCCFSSNSSEFLYMAFDSSRKCCSNFLSAPLRFVL